MLWTNHEKQKRLAGEVPHALPATDADDDHSPATAIGFQHVVQDQQPHNTAGHQQYYDDGGQGFQSGETFNVPTDAHIPLQPEHIRRYPSFSVTDTTLVPLQSNDPVPGLNDLIFNALQLTFDNDYHSTNQFQATPYHEVLPEGAVFPMEVDSLDFLHDGPLSSPEPLEQALHQRSDRPIPTTEETYVCTHFPGLDNVVFEDEYSHNGVANGHPLNESSVLRHSRKKKKGQYRPYDIPAPKFPCSKFRFSEPGSSTGSSGMQF